MTSFDYKCFLLIIVHVMSQANDHTDRVWFIETSNVIMFTHSKTRICAAEMAVRYAALIGCRKVRMPSVRAEKYMCVIVIR